MRQALTDSITRIEMEEWLQKLTQTLMMFNHNLTFCSVKWPPLTWGCEALLAQKLGCISHVNSHVKIFLVWGQTLCRAWFGTCSTWQAKSWINVHVLLRGQKKVLLGEHAMMMDFFSNSLYISESQVIEVNLITIHYDTEWQWCVKKSLKNC